MFDRLLATGWGTLDLAFADRGHRLGDTLTGSVTVAAKRAIGPGRLYLILSCHETQTRTIHSAGGGAGPRIRPGRSGGRGPGAGIGFNVGVGIDRERSTRRLWRGEFDVAAGVSLDAGSSSVHPFSFQLPDPLAEEPEPQIPDWARGLVAIIDAATFRQSELSWKLQARYSHDAGFDLRHTKSLTINP